MVRERIEFCEHLPTTTAGAVDHDRAAGPKGERNDDSFHVRFGCRMGGVRVALHPAKGIGHVK